MRDFKFNIKIILNLDYLNHHHHEMSSSKVSGSIIISASFIPRNILVITQGHQSEFIEV